MKRGCTTVDIVMNVGALRDGDFKMVKEELNLFAKAAGNALTKAILEVCYLSKDEIAAGSKMIAEAGIKFAKTSTWPSSFRIPCGAKTSTLPTGLIAMAVVRRRQDLFKLKWISPAAVWSEQRLMGRADCRKDNP